MKTDRRFFQSILAPAVVFLLVLMVFPMAFNVYLSFQVVSTTLSQARFVGLNNWVALVADNDFWQSLELSLTYMIGVVGIELILGLAIATQMNRQFRGSRILQSLFILPMVITPIVVALSWKMLYHPEFGMINIVIRDLGYKGYIDFLGNVNLALPSVMLIDVWEWTPFVSLILLSGLKLFPQEPFEAATIDGASSWQSFRHLTLPMLRPVMLVAVMFRAVDCLKVFDTILGTTGGGPGIATQTLNVYAVLTNFWFFHLGYGAAIGLVLNFLSLGVAMFLIRLLVRTR